MMVDFISIYKVDLFDIEIGILHQIMGVITKTKCNNKQSLDKFPSLRFEN